MIGTRVMIADDYDVVRRGVRNLLEAQSGLQVVAEPANGRAALEEARATRPDIAVVDYLLPELNGLDLTVALKRELPRTEVLIYTMHQRENLIFDVLRAGARGFVFKSETEKHLLAAVTALSNHRPYFSGAISEALLDRFLHASPAAPAALTPREREVVQLVAEGKSNKDVANILGISSKTVETHRAAIMHKLELKCTADLVRYALRNNIIRA